MNREMKEQRFWAKVEPTGFCWLWVGREDRDGYGQANFLGKTTAAHRTAYKLLIGEIPEGLVIDHLCNVRLCVNPDHLEPVTHNENLARAKARRGLATSYTRVKTPRDKSKCLKGHALIEGNILRTVRSNGRERLRCLTCQHQTQAAHRARQGLKPRGPRGAYGPRAS